jgi:hypothetical protein
MVTIPKIGAMYLDIETTAAPNDVSASISSIAWWCDQKWHSWVNGRDDPAEFLMYWQFSEALVTFNGKTFDEPKIMRHFHIGPHRNHLDIMYMARGQELTGGLKKIGSLCGFPRPPELDNVDGSIAIKLWEEYLYHQDEDALQNLLYYNAWDVALTYYLHNHLLSTQASVIHESIPFHLNFESMSSVVSRYPKRSPLQRKTFDNTPDYRVKRKNTPFTITIVSNAEGFTTDASFSPEGEEDLSIASPSPKRDPLPRKISGDLLEYWVERKKNPLATLRDAEVCITGDLSSLEREEALSIVTRLGGTPKRSVTRTLDFLVVGTDAGCTKVFNAEKNIQDGSHLRMITETDFLELIKRTEEEQVT